LTFASAIKLQILYRSPTHTQASSVQDAPQTLAHTQMMLHFNTVAYQKKESDLQELHIKSCKRESHSWPIAMAYKALEGADTCISMPSSRAALGQSCTPSLHCSTFDEEPLQDHPAGTICGKSSPPRGICLHRGSLVLVVRHQLCMARLQRGCESDTSAAIYARAVQPRQPASVHAASAHAQPRVSRHRGRQTRVRCATRGSPQTAHRCCRRSARAAAAA